MGDRTTHAHTGELAVFLIGMRINAVWRPDLWGPTIAAMRPMLTELYENKAAARAGDVPWWGFYDARTMVDGRGPTVLQYWRSVDDIYAYANDTELRHRPAWGAFYRRARRGDGAVGIWHETYRIPAGGHESIYTGMAPTGLARATGSVPVARRGERARERIASWKG
ncbi:DUF4188 domain-containing protein [Leekyejoonella antrihumi]|uniref:DUF4188 domain-containing protein n=1 Tax=Leekyejoonella antrihumi TaxID=1660198 RepID=A0A563DZN5_9MICO|nr:DUF4188 domain-containing protein [Leekyejoonella antrihumi]TWP35697.1 DUF4188 domain-containing protein [Leekyejoonella antrihumi]